MVLINPEYIPPSINKPFTGIVDHSPRPWKPKISKNGKRLSLTSREDKRIAVIDTDTEDGWANAKLISAAPFLLEAALIGYRVLSAGIEMGVISKDAPEIKTAHKFIDDAITMAVILEEEDTETEETALATVEPDEPVVEEAEHVQAE